MDELVIKRHSFDATIKRLKEFSEKPGIKLEIERVRTDRFFGLGNHKVTGSEFNERLGTIQRMFIDINAINNKVIKEFQEVYNALNLLDKDYITSIVTYVKAIEKTNNDVRIQQGILKQHNQKLTNQQSKLNEHQVEIEKNVANISKIVKALKAFKEKLEGYDHLTDIDRIWKNYKILQSEIREVSDSLAGFSKIVTEDIIAIKNSNKNLSDHFKRDILDLRNESKLFKDIFSELSEKINHTADLLNYQIPIIQEVSSIIEKLKNITHMDDIDLMWDDINEAKESFNNIENRLGNFDGDILKINKHIDEIDSFITILNGYTHLQDIDSIWNDLDIVKTNIQDIKGEIKGNSKNIQMHQNELNTLITISSEHKEIIDALQLNLKKVEQQSKLHTDKLNELEKADDRIREGIDSNARSITVLKEYTDKLSDIYHLEDVDNIWKDVEEHKSKLVECEKRDEDLATTVQKNKEEVNQNIAEAVQTANAAIESLTKKVKYAYWIAGGSAGLAIVELILLLMKVI